MLHKLQKFECSLNSAVWALGNPREDGLSNWKAHGEILEPEIRYTNAKEKLRCVGNPTAGRLNTCNLGNPRVDGESNWKAERKQINTVQ